MKTLLISFIAMFGILLGGCASMNGIPTGMPIRKDFTHTNLSVKIIVYPNNAALSRACLALVPKEASSFGVSSRPIQVWLNGCATWDPQNNVCIIRVQEPTNTGDTSDIETWGHELLHCTYGNWHIAGAVAE